MKVFNRVSFTLGILCFFTFLSYGQEVIFMPNLDPIGLKKDFQYSVTNLLKTYIEDAKKYRVVIPLRNDSNAITADQEELAVAYAKSINAKYYLLGTLTRLGETVVVRISLYETLSRNVVWSDRLKASSPEDLDPIMQRIGTNLGTENTASANADIYGVTKYESKELKKINPNMYFGAALSGFVPFNKITDEPVAGFCGAWSYDARTIILDIRGSYYFNRVIDIYGVTFDVLYPLSKESKTFFVNGGLAIGGTTLSYKTSSSTNNYSYTVSNTSGGFLLNTGGGYIFNRTSAAQLRLSGNLIHGFYRVNDKTTTGFAFKLEFLFK